MMSLRMEICKEIIKEKLYDKPDYLDSFMMTVYCFDDPDKQEQVSLCFSRMNVLYIGGVDPNSRSLVQPDYGSVHSYG